mmetsp:Transcript_75577/g.130813  ORF Transcript_75577/g.130813 Transcript_75577/m.130813 type:complete len:137 (+) Transcript_75577:1187-1597(+)
MDALRGGGVLQTSAFMVARAVLGDETILSVSAEEEHVGFGAAAVPSPVVAPRPPSDDLFGAPPRLCRASFSLRPPSPSGGLPAPASPVLGLDVFPSSLPGPSVDTRGAPKKDGSPAPGAKPSELLLPASPVREPGK